MKKALKILGWTVFISGITVLLGFVDADYKKLNFNKLIIDIDMKHGHSFIKEDEVLRRLNDIGVKININNNESIDIYRIEQMLKELSETKNVEVYCYNNGELHIEIEQRNPIARIISNQDRSSYYLDDDGKKMSLSNSYVARVPVFNGFIIENSYSRNKKLAIKTDKVTQVDDIYQIASVISNDEFFKSQIVQIYVNEKGKYELIPRIGNQRILFGYAENIELKFKKIKKFYTHSLSSKELNLYDTLNVMYSNQIICSKR